MLNESLASPGKKSSSTFMGDGVTPMPRTIVLSRSPAVEKATSPLEVFCLCVGGVALSLLITKVMMIPFGTWDDECEKSLVEILGLDPERSQIVGGIASWFTKTGTKVESR
jgi:hypothetical protein